MIDFERYHRMTDAQRGRLSNALRETVAASGEIPAPSARYASGGSKGGGVGFSLFFFADRGGRAAEGVYDLLLRSAKVADEAGLEALWLPERHFHEFGAAYPNPSVLAAAIATTTRRIGIRSGSVVLPLHDPVRVIEEWSVVDNLSGGRIGLSIASGWHPADFEILAKVDHANRRAETDRLIRLLLRGWISRSLASIGHSTNLPIFPMPLQPILPLWMTSSKNPATWEAAGRLGSGVLSGLMEQSFDELAQNVAIYRTALDEAGHGAASGKVTLMLHTFIAHDAREAARLARPALADYLRNHMRMYEGLLRSGDHGVDLESVSEADREALVNQGLSRYLERSALIGSVESVLPLCRRLAEVGVDEIACLVDFGVPSDAVVESVARIPELACALRREPVAALVGVTE